MFKLNPLYIKQAPSVEGLSNLIDNLYKTDYPINVINIGLEDSSIVDDLKRAGNYVLDKTKEVGTYLLNLIKEIINSIKSFLNSNKKEEVNAVREDIKCLFKQSAEPIPVTVKDKLTKFIKDSYYSTDDKVINIDLPPSLKENLISYVKAHRIVNNKSIIGYDRLHPGAYTALVDLLKNVNSVIFDGLIKNNALIAKVLNAFHGKVNITSNLESTIDSYNSTKDIAEKKATLMINDYLKTYFDEGVEETAFKKAVHKLVDRLILLPESSSNNAVLPTADDLLTSRSNFLSVDKKITSLTKKIDHYSTIVKNAEEELKFAEKSLTENERKVDSFTDYEKSIMELWRDYTSTTRTILTFCSKIKNILEYGISNEIIMLRKYTAVVKAVKKLSAVESKAGLEDCIECNSAPSYVPGVDKSFSNLYIK